jgi:hypothetical protein
MEEDDISSLGAKRFVDQDGAVQDIAIQFVLQILKTHRLVL